MSSVSPPELEQPNLSQKALPAHASPDGEKPKGSKMRMVFYILLILAVIVFAVWQIHSNMTQTASNNARTAAAGNIATPIQSAAVMQKTMPIYLTALGSVTAYNTDTIKTRVDGQLLSVNFNEGQTVHKGDLLLQIDPRPYQAAVDQAIGQLAKDEANLKNMEAEAQRYTSLYEAGVVSKEQQQLEVSNQGQAAGSIKADEAAIEAAKVNLAYTSIAAPIDGVVGLRQVDPGNIVHAADANGLIIITQIRPIAVIFTIPEDQLPQVLQMNHAGKKLVVEAWDRSDTTKIATGTLLTLDNQIDQTTGTVKIKAVFQNENGSLFPNQFVNARLILEQQQNAIVVPSAAVQIGSNSSIVYVVHQGPEPANLLAAFNAAGGAGGGGRRSGGGGGNASGRSAGGGNRAGSQNGSGYYVTTQNVKTGVTEGSEVIITAGLQPGQQVVIDGQEKLKNGSPVSLSRPTASSTTPGAGTNGGLNSAVIGAAAAGTTSGTPTTPSTHNVPGSAASGNAAPNASQNPNNSNHQHGKKKNGQSGGQSGKGGQGQTQ